MRQNIGQQGERSRLGVEKIDAVIRSYNQLILISHNTQYYIRRMLSLIHSIW